jgi:hypothetical protein
MQIDAMNDDPRDDVLETLTDHFHYDGNDFTMTVYRVKDRDMAGAIGGQWSATATTDDPNLRFNMTPDDLGNADDAADVFGRLRTIISSYLDNNPSEREEPIP